MALIEGKFGKLLPDHCSIKIQADYPIRDQRQCFKNTLDSYVLHVDFLLVRGWKAMSYDVRFAGSYERHSETFVNPMFFAQWFVLSGAWLTLLWSAAPNSGSHAFARLSGFINPQRQSGSRSRAFLFTSVLWLPLCAFGYLINTMHISKAAGHVETSVASAPNVHCNNDSLPRPGLVQAHFIFGPQTHFLYLNSDSHFAIAQSLHL